MTPATSESSTFETELSELERILRQLEDGGTSLDESLKYYERGVALIRGCRDRLLAAESRVYQLTGTDANGKPTFAPFEQAPGTEAPAEAVKKPSKPRLRDSDSGY